MCKKNSVKRPFTKGWLIGTVAAFVIAVVFIIIGITGYCHLKNFSQDFRNNFIIIYSGIIGGFCTLLGVIMTIHNEISSKAQKQKIDNIPVFYINTDPHNFYGTEKFYFFEADTKRKRKSPLPEKFIHIKNTDKAPFSFKTIICNKLAYEGKENFIEKNKLFCITFDLPKKKKIDDLVVKVVSIDKYVYFYRIIEEDESIELLTEKEAKEYASY